MSIWCIEGLDDGTKTLNRQEESHRCFQCFTLKILGFHEVRYTLPG